MSTGTIKIRTILASLFRNRTATPHGDIEFDHQGIAHVTHQQAAYLEKVNESQIAGTNGRAKPHFVLNEKIDYDLAAPTRTTDEDIARARAILEGQGFTVAEKQDDAPKFIPATGAQEPETPRAPFVTGDGQQRAPNDAPPSDEIKKSEADDPQATGKTAPKPTARIRATRAGKPDPIAEEFAQVQENQSLQGESDTPKNAAGFDLAPGVTPEDAARAAAVRTLGGAPTLPSGVVVTTGGKAHDPNAEMRSASPDADL